MCKFRATITEAGGTPTLAASYNVDSIADSGVGVYTITITTDFSADTYSVTICGTEADMGEESISTKAVGSCVTKIVNSGDTATEDRGVDVCGFGDQ